MVWCSRNLEAIRLLFFLWNIPIKSFSCYCVV